VSWCSGIHKLSDYCVACSPVERVVKVIKAAIKNSFRRKRPQAAAGSSSGYDGPVNLPEGIAAAMRKTHSYMWLDNAVKDTSAPEGAASCCPAVLLDTLKLLLHVVEQTAGNEACLKLGLPAGKQAST
jgi:hypothetical protein